MRVTIGIQHTPNIIVYYVPRDGTILAGYAGPLPQNKQLIFGLGSVKLTWTLKWNIRRPFGVTGFIEREMSARDVTDITDSANRPTHTKSVHTPPQHHTADHKDHSRDT